MIVFFFLYRYECGFYGVESARKKHAEECTRRPINCYNKSCDWQGDIKQLKQHVSDAHKYICRVRKYGTDYSMTINPKWIQILWHHSMDDDVHFVVMMYKYDDIISFACCALDDKVHGTATVRNAKAKHSVEITIPIESIRDYTTVESREKLPGKVALSYFTNNEFDLCFNVLNR